MGFVLVDYATAARALRDVLGRLFHELEPIDHTLLTSPVFAVQHDHHGQGCFRFFSCFVLAVVRGLLCRRFFQANDAQYRIDFCKFPTMAV